MKVELCESHIVCKAVNKIYTSYIAQFHISDILMPSVNQHVRHNRKTIRQCFKKKLGNSTGKKKKKQNKTKEDKDE